MPDPKPAWDVATHGPLPKGHEHDYDVIDSSGRNRPPAVIVPSESEPVVQKDLPVDPAEPSVPEPEPTLGVVAGQVPSESNREQYPTHAASERTGEAEAPPPWET